jgi:UDP-2,4-diacetamido-2,4,6-trideoxy-beta-L-altropyranose hydrolase
MSWPEAALRAPAGPRGPVLFRAPAGPRRGFGHLLRCRALARAMGVRPVVALRGTPATRRAARRLGVVVVAGSPASALRATGARLLVVDDPVARAAARWIAAARRAGRPVASIHDLGVGCLDADLVIDGSVITPALVARNRTLTGLRYAVIDAAFSLACIPSGRRVQRVLVSLGGGPRRHQALAIAKAIAARLPRAVVRVVGGFGPRPAANAIPIQSTPFGRCGVVAETGAVDGLRRELRRCDLAVVAGGVSLYEACASGVPTVALPVVGAQTVTVRAFARRGACRGLANVAAPPQLVAREVAMLAADARRRRALARSARRLVDGHGAGRVAAALARLVDGGLCS